MKRYLKQLRRQPQNSVAEIKSPYGWDTVTASAEKAAEPSDCHAERNRRRDYIAEFQFDSGNFFYYDNAEHSADKPADNRFAVQYLNPCVSLKNQRDFRPDYAAYQSGKYDFHCAFAYLTTPF